MRNNRAKSDPEMSKQHSFESLCKVISKGINGLYKNGLWWATTFDHLLLGVEDGNLNSCRYIKCNISVLGP